jgi:hypothetical protein
VQVPVVWAGGDGGVVPGTSYHCWAGIRRSRRTTLCRRVLTLCRMQGYTGTTHSFTNSLARSLTHSPTHTLTQPPIHHPYYVLNALTKQNPVLQYSLIFTIPVWRSSHKTWPITGGVGVEELVPPEYFNNSEPSTLFSLPFPPDDECAVS